VSQGEQAFDLKEAAFWGGMKKAVKESPGKICRK
jgi:hypothetical protein